jgi:hypothetical protein
MPAMSAAHVENELDRLTYSTATRGERHLAPARPAGEGVYTIARHDDHTHLAFALELPERPGEVQEELNIPREGSYIITVMRHLRSACRRTVDRNCRSGYVSDSTAAGSSLSIRRTSSIERVPNSC